MNDPYHSVPTDTLRSYSYQVDCRAADKVLSTSGSIYIYILYIHILYVEQVGQRPYILKSSSY